jgi:hypothetical protein
MKQVQI